ncbi:hypothetical protein [Pseudomonas syringae]|uniref:hypothetical protein n=1 Tax=Pseudomonas syringae TaxID=317 RepID=UPI0005161E68|nr:hypothetical protein [Pseudomonas syringae]
MSLPSTARQRRAVLALQRVDPDLGQLAAAVALAFDASKIDNPELARLILEKTCRRIAAKQVASREALVQHLEHFGALECLSHSDVVQFSGQITKISL